MAPRKFLLTGLAAGTTLGGYIWDQNYNSQALSRNAKAAYNAAYIAYEYKFNFTRAKAQDLENLHDRVAKRIFRVCTENGK
jgi:aarF domain-containing kinase